MTREQVREKIWFIAQNIRIGNLSEVEAVDQILALTDDSGNLLLLERNPDQSLPEVPYFHYPDDEADYRRGQQDMIAQKWVKVI